jgi:hypothetical protein
MAIAEYAIRISTGHYQTYEVLCVYISIPINSHTHTLQIKLLYVYMIELSLSDGVHTVGIILKSKMKIVERGKTDTPDTWPLSYRSHI